MKPFRITLDFIRIKHLCNLFFSDNSYLVKHFYDTAMFFFLFYNFVINVWFFSSVTEHWAYSWNCSMPYQCILADGTSEYQKCKWFLSSACFLPKDGNSCLSSEPPGQKSNVNLLSTVWQGFGSYSHQWDLRVSREQGRWEVLPPGPQGHEEPGVQAKMRLLAPEGRTRTDCGEDITHWDVLPVLLELWACRFEEGKEKTSQILLKGKSRCTVT